MILTETSSRKPTRIGFWIVLGMGALLLPLAPQAARTEALQESEQTDSQNRAAGSESEAWLLFSNPHHFTIGMQSCTTCHASQHVHPQDLQRKPQSWREAHDEIVRLMDELRRRQAEFQNAVNRLPAAAKPDRSEEFEKLQDEIELLKVQVRLKEARVAAPKAMVNEYRRRLNNYIETNRTQRGAIPRDTLEEARIALTTQEGQLKISEAELQEALLRLKQAERRLARLQPAKNQNELAPKMAWNVTWAEALFDQRTHELGSVPHGTIVERRFIMTNHGQRDVHIANIRTSDGALQATTSRHELAPGATAVIQAKLDTSRFVGDKNIKIHIQFDKPERQEVVLEIHANSQATVPAKPQRPERLQELEKKLDELRKEMDNLRREMRPDKPRDPRSAPAGLKR